MEPDIPHDVPAVFPILFIKSKEPLPHISIQCIIELSAPVFLPVDFCLFQTAVLIKGHASVIEEIIVIYLIETSFCQ